MELAELRVFLKVAAERSFSRAAMKLHRTQPAVSQSVRRLEESVGERLFDRATKDATLTDAGRLLRDYAERLLRLSEEAEIAVKDLRDLRRGRVLIGANEASVHVVLPLIARFRESHPSLKVIAGGLISNLMQVDALVKAGVDAVSLSRPELWVL